MTGLRLTYTLETRMTAHGSDSNGWLRSTGEMVEENPRHSRSHNHNPGLYHDETRSDTTMIHDGSSDLH